MNTTTDYQKQATDFLHATGTTFTCEFLKNGKHFPDDTENRDVYKITLKRGTRSYSFNFGQSLNKSGFFALYGRQKYFIPRDKLGLNKGLLVQYVKQQHNSDFNRSKNDKFQYPEAPTPYDVLACLTKSDPGTFEDFCREFGYDTDSRKAEKTYLAVKDEWQNVCALFTDAEIEQLQEIS